jgi:excisionase family DNA binding protein
VDDERWQSVQEIAEYLSVSTDSIYRWVEQRDLPVHRIGRLMRFKRAEIDQWVRGQTAITARRVTAPSTGKRGKTAATRR